jgi:hypothetical protein
MNDKTLDTPHCYFELKEGIVFGTYKGRITLESAKKVVKTRLEFTEGKSYPVCVKTIYVTAINKDARDYFSTEEANKGIKAGAIYVDSVFQSFMGNFFLKVSKPKVPSKVFTDRKKAIKWLEQFK